MKAAQRRRIARAICALLPSLREKGRLLAATPHGRVLRGVFLEDSSDPTGVYVWAFVQPLYVPRETIVLNLGERLGGGTRTWTIEDADAAAVLVRDEGAPFFQPIGSPEALANWRFLNGRTDDYAQEARAYSLVAAGRMAEGAGALRELARSIPGKTGGTVWIVEMKRRAEQLAELAKSNPHAAHALLAKWEAETATALRVQDLS